MRVLHKFVGLFSVVALSAVVAGCGTDVSSKIACSDDASCVKAAGSLLAADASADMLPTCCGGFCVLPSAGCETGVRYLTSAPAFGTCVPDSVCPPPPLPTIDMSTPPEDMTPPPGDGG